MDWTTHVDQSHPGLVADVAERIVADRGALQLPAAARARSCPVAVGLVDGYARRSHPADVDPMAVTDKNGKRGPTPRFQQQIERLGALPQAQQRLVMQMLDGVIAQAGR